MSTEVLGHTSGLQSMDHVIRIQEAQQVLCSKLRDRVPDVATSFAGPSQFMLPNLCSVLSGEAQPSDCSVTKDDTVVCHSSESLAASHNRLVSSQHLPLHEVVISKFGVDDAPFTLREESVFRQIVRNGNVEFCPDIAILIEPVSSETLSCFLPGDQLIAINDVIIESKEEAWHAVAECQLETLTLSVRPLAELTDLSVRYIHSRGDKAPRKVSYLSSVQQKNTRVSA